MNIFYFIAINLIYAWLLIYLFIKWIKIPSPQNINISNFPFVSVIVAARNEEKNIASLLYSLSKQTYPNKNFEIIIVDDHSTDGTIKVIEQVANSLPHQVVLISLSDDNEKNSFKKKAITEAIKKSRGEIILTTDADCIPPPDWISAVVSHKQSFKAVMVAAPVKFVEKDNWLCYFQSLDFLMLQAISGAVVYHRIMNMSNGANFCYDKSAFNIVGGFENINHIASGDDMLLMEKIAKQFPEQIVYLKSNNAIVPTQPVETWKEFFNQRIRWASKSNSYAGFNIKLVLLFVYLYNLNFLFLACLSFFNFNYFILLIAGLTFKTFVELPLLISSAKFFKSYKSLPYFVLLQPVHILYTCVVGWLSQWTKYEWKGRRVK